MDQVLLISHLVCLVPGEGGGTVRPTSDRIQCSVLLEE